MSPCGCLIFHFGYFISCAEVSGRLNQMVLGFLMKSTERPFIAVPFKKEPDGILLRRCSLAHCRTSLYRGLTRDWNFNRSSPRIVYFYDTGKIGISIHNYIFFNFIIQT